MGEFPRAPARRSPRQLDEGELLGRGRRPEVGTIVGERLAIGIPSSFTMVIDDFLPKGGLVTTTSACQPGSLRRASSVWIGGCVASFSLQRVGRPCHWAWIPLLGIIMGVNEVILRPSRAV